MKSYQEQIMEVLTEKHKTMINLSESITVFDEAVRDCFTIQRLEQEMAYYRQLHDIPYDRAADEKRGEVISILAKYNIKP